MLNLIRQILLGLLLLPGVAFSQIYKGNAPNVQQSVEFVRLSDGKVLFSKNPDTLLTPASVTKLVTSAAVLAKFGANHLFKTRFYYTGSRTAGVISGDLIIVGDGDPFVVSEKFWHQRSIPPRIGSSIARFWIRSAT